MATILAFRARPADAGHTDAVIVRGRAQTLHIYGTRGSGDPVIVSSGDGGWIHLASHTAETLAAAGFFVVGIDSRAFLSQRLPDNSNGWFDDVARDYRTIVDWAAPGAGRKPVLVGLSEGAGLSVLAAGASDTRASIAGVVVLGLPAAEPFTWTWKDAIRKVAPVPVAVIHSRQDEYVSLEVAEELMAVAGEPHRLWVVGASNHVFRGAMAELDRRLLDAIRWIKDG
jgi:alpha-beta hydrolase superfamily lysophospholipase